MFRLRRLKKLIAFGIVGLTILCLMRMMYVRPSPASQMIPDPSPQLNQPEQKEPQYKSRSLPRPVFNGSLEDSAVSNAITVVTAYFNIGRFQKGESGKLFYDPNSYMHWIRVFARIENPVVAYFDTQQDMDYFNKHRQQLGANNTKTVLISRDELWAFGLYAQIKSIISDPSYPRFEPNTVLPEYACVMHAKYELMQRTIVGNPFKTKYFCWLDVGLFRAIAKEHGPSFKLHLPPKFDAGKVAYTEVTKPYEAKVALEQIFLSNAVWVCGCFFIAEQSVMLRWAQEYMQYTQLFLDQGYSNTDQQVIYAICNHGKPQTSIQTYRSKGSGYNIWFYLGYLCKE